LESKSSLGLDQCKLATLYTSMTYVVLPYIVHVQYMYSTLFLRYRSRDILFQCCRTRDIERHVCPHHLGVLPVSYMSLEPLGSEHGQGESEM
jgi:hypothetical protein